MEEYQILCLDDDPRIHRDLQLILRPSFKIIPVLSAQALPAIMAENVNIDLILLDLRVADSEGFALVGQLREMYPYVSILVFTDSLAIIDRAKASISDVEDFLLKSDYIDQRSFAEFTNMLIDEIEHPKNIAKRVSRMAKTIATPLSDELIDDMPDCPIIGDSSSIREARRSLRIAANNPDLSVLIVGETGVGKGLAVRTLHHYSKTRKDYPLEDIHISHLMPHFEKSLFGEFDLRSGEVVKEGLLERANQGIVFFDEIGDWDIKQQSVLLRLLDTKKVRPFGRAKDAGLDIQIVASTNLNLEQTDDPKPHKTKKALPVSGQNSRERSIRKELFHRFDLVIFIPPLSERPGDILLLLKHYLKFESLKDLKEAFTPRLTYDFLWGYYKWPGNINEIISVSKHINIFRKKTGAKRIGIEALPLLMRKNIEAHISTPRYSSIKGEPLVYISYSQEDVRRKEELVRCLKFIRKDIQIFNRVDSIVGGDNEKEKLDEVRAKCNFYIFLISPVLFGLAAYEEDLAFMKNKKAEYVFHPIKIRQCDCSDDDDLQGFSFLYEACTDENSDEFWLNVNYEIKSLFAARFKK